MVISSLVFYYEMQSFEKKKLAQLSAYISLIEYIKNQVECFLLPIDKILSSADRELICACTLTDAQDFKTLNDLIDGTSFYLNSESIGTVKVFADEFGVGYRAQQLRSCEYCITELMRQRDKQKEKNTKEKKVRLALCLCASFSIVLLLL